MILENIRYSLYSSEEGGYLQDGNFN
jgi:hypothetical protein